jgi:predicted RNase H-like HicB family nuclease
MNFLIAIEPGSETTAWGVVVPDLPGCFSAGDSLEEAFDMAREAITAHCEAIAQSGGELPLLAPLAVHQADPDLAGWIWADIEASV